MSAHFHSIGYRLATEGGRSVTSVLPMRGQRLGSGPSARRLALGQRVAYRAPKRFRRIFTVAVWPAAAAGGGSGWEHFCRCKSGPRLRFPAGLKNCSHRFASTVTPPMRSTGLAGDVLSCSASPGVPWPPFRPRCPGTCRLFPGAGSGPCPSSWSQAPRCR